MIINLNLEGRFEVTAVRPLAVTIDVKGREPFYLTPEEYKVFCGTLEKIKDILEQYLQEG